ncbi:MAG: hypothetical protein ACKPKO_05605, partial [Candidatus Fonsibacter sp.]
MGINSRRTVLWYVDPFGAKVVFKPYAKSDSTTKMEPTSLTGVFAGYELASGYIWSGIYVVW